MVVTVKQWKTLFFVPAFPLKKLGRYVECQSCGGTFDESAKHFDPAKEEALLEAWFETALVQVVIAMARADGMVEEGELDMIASVLTKMTGRAFEVEDVQTALAAAPGPSLKETLQVASSRLNERGKMLILAALCAIATADGEMSEEESTLMIDSGRTLGFRRSEVERILAGVPA
jgi:uncharacterized membrane protein YebE (DUF533 family)